MDPAKEIELSALAMQKSMNEVIDRGDSAVQQFYCGTTVFVTGGSGFLGKQLIEKLFRSCTIKKLYILTRSKKGKSINQRLNDMLTDSLFDSVRSKQPQFADRIVPVEGDVAVLKLGLKTDDWHTLTENVNVIFHAAATIRFDEPLRKATFTNLRGTREVLALAKQCDQLKKIVHVSTAFSHATQERIDTDVCEQFYPCPISPTTLIALAEELDPARLDSVTANLIKGWPNTYTFTKALAEELIRTTAGDLPVCVVRPPIVIPAYVEPNPGWLDISSIVGPSGVLMGSGLGVLRVFRTDVNGNLAVASVDYVNNTIIAAGWDSTRRKNNGETDIPVYTIVKNLRFGLISDVGMSQKHRLSSPKAVWYYGPYQTKYMFLYTLLSWFFHYIPAYTADFICKSLGKMPKQIKSFPDIFRTIDKLAAIYVYFIDNEWNFRDDNTKAMMSRMSPADRAIFNCDFESVDFEHYILVWATGLRKYIVKDSLEGTAEAARRQIAFKIGHYLYIVFLLYALWWLSSTVISVFVNLISIFLN